MAASRLFVAISARALADIDPSLTLPQLRTLVVLESQGPVKLAALASVLGVNPSTAMRMIDKLEAIGFAVHHLFDEERLQRVDGVLPGQVQAAAGEQERTQRWAARALSGRTQAAHAPDVTVLWVAAAAGNQNCAPPRVTWHHRGASPVADLVCAACSSYRWMISSTESPFVSGRNV
ncbi:MarR family transcriptional regulator [Streptantibioticus ferralitis]|uniref:MarR family transcriptional regulator n=2 Tax=Streptantibioticus ferralitis TaxID=236510 RepID=A0ABT5ZE68_9ACTN|nr:MarR family transcriptional regulator [Streptantibioticus ferralitis]MDF2261330.1 MarR family transcriptional regulator [Streptantibioticus ferralitis]